MRCGQELERRKRTNGVKRTRAKTRSVRIDKIGEYTLTAIVSFVELLMISVMVVSTLRVVVEIGEEMNCV